MYQVQEARKIFPMIMLQVYSAIINISKDTVNHALLSVDDH